MADAMVISADPPPPLSTDDYDSGLSIPPFDAAFFSQHFVGNDNNRNDVVVAAGDLDFDFDFSFDGLILPSADELDDLFNPDHNLQFGSDSIFDSNPSQSRRVSVDRSSDVLSPGSNGSDRETSENCGGGDEKVSNWPSPESRVSENCGSNVSEDSNAASSSPNLINMSAGVVNHKVKLEEVSKSKGNSSLLKRKKGCDDLPNNGVESKCRKSSCDRENSDTNDNSGGLSGEDEKRKARLIRNRESAHLSRQRKKHYVEELEEKVKMMHSTIQDLNVKVSYFMAENATLRQQMGGGGGGGVVPPPPPMAVPPYPGMMYNPWMPYAPPYMVKPHGSQVPLVPIPRLKPQPPVQAPKPSKKAESKKSEGPKTKKVASVSFLGLLFFFMLFGGLVPMVNVRYGGIREALTGGETYVGNGFYEKHYGRVLMVNGTEHGDRRDFNCKSSVLCDQSRKPTDEFVRSCNGSEPLVASLYVPRNDKLVKIDGNLIIHSVLASEKTMSSHGGTGLAVHGDLGPSIPIPGVHGVRHPHLKALGSGSADRVSWRPNATDGRLQQWFREGLAGPMLSSGMCTEVFQFDVSSASTAGAIIPATATTTRNISEERNQNSTHLSKSKNRRILRGLPIPLPESSHDVSRQHTRKNSQKDNLNGNNTVSPMVVSVLVDPREVGDADVDGVMGAKSISRIFVVVLIDSVKYVTYSCMLPFKGSAPHVVTA